MSPQTPTCRTHWVATLLKIVTPVLAATANGRLTASIPVGDGQKAERTVCAPMEAFCRSLMGVAPWLEAQGLSSEEFARQQEIITLIKSALQHAADPESPDFLNFGENSPVGGQSLVEAAFLALGLMRSRHVIWEALEPLTRQNLTQSLKASRCHKAPLCNWLLFPATVEAFLASIGEEGKEGVQDFAIQKHEEWYKGDGAYGDGPFFHWDYYNSFVIQPMLLEILRMEQNHQPDRVSFRNRVMTRAQRYAMIQERLIGPDGTFPPIGRSLAYRFGAFHHLALMALWDKLPAEIPPAQVRCALTAVMDRTMNAPGTFNKNGWLTIGLCGTQPGIAERYITTGSVYLTTAGFLPLGLPPSHPFWSEPDLDWTSKKVWAGRDVPADHDLSD